jgi:hypothetical protein
MDRTTITIGFDWSGRVLREAEADGGACDICGDSIFMGKREFFVPFKINGNPDSDGLKLDICQGCAEMWTEIDRQLHGLIINPQKKVHPESEQ